MTNYLKSLCLSIFCLSTFALHAQSYNSAESVEYDPVNKQWLASNGDNIIANDGNGNLSYFGNGTATHGMEIMDTVLFAIDNNILRAYSLNTGTQISFLFLTGTVFLNGLTNDGDAYLYATDFGTKKIYRIDVSDLQNMSYSEIVGNTGSTPNGIVHDAENNRLIFVSWGSNAAIKAVDLSNNQVSTILNTGLTNVDGIDDDNEGNYYISSWNPARITKYDKDFANPPEIITTPSLNAPADIGYSKETDTLGIPMATSVIFVGFEPDTTVNLKIVPSEIFDFIVFPNPVSDQSYVQFELENDQELTLQIIDNQGRMVKSLLNGQQPAGKHKVLLAGLSLNAGIYHLRLQNKRSTVTRKILIH